MIRWGQVNKPINTLDATKDIYLTEVYRQACELLSLPTPVDDTKDEGAHDQAWQLPATQGSITMGSDRFIDGNIFRPGKLIEYLETFTVHHMNDRPESFFKNP